MTTASPKVPRAPRSPKKEKQEGLLIMLMLNLAFLAFYAALIHKEVSMGKNHRELVGIAAVGYGFNVLGLGLIIWG